MEISSASLPGRDAYALMTACVIPRPVAWISTLSRDGNRNLAPFSYFMGVGSKPSTLAVSIGQRRGHPKDTLENIRQTGEFVVNICPRSLVQAMVATSGEFEPDVDEFQVAGVNPVDSMVVKPPGVAESPVRLECRLSQVVPVALAELVLGEVMHFHIDDAVISEGLPDPGKVDPIARLGGRYYASLGELIELARPDSLG